MVQDDSFHFETETFSIIMFASMFNSCYVSMVYSDKRLTNINNALAIYDIPHFQRDGLPSYIFCSLSVNADTFVASLFKTGAYLSE